MVTRDPQLLCVIGKGAPQIIQGDLLDLIFRSIAVPPPAIIQASKVQPNTSKTYINNY